MMKMRVSCEQVKAVSLAARAVVEARRRAGLTQTELGLRIGTDQKGVWRLESGRQNATVETLEKVARATSGVLDISIKPLLKRLVRIVRVRKRNEAINSGDEMLPYWLAQPPADRIEAALNLRRDAYKLIYGRDLPRMTKVVRVIERKRG